MRCCSQLKEREKLNGHQDLILISHPRKNWGNSGFIWPHFFLLRKCHLQTLQGSAVHTGLWSGSIFHVPPLAHTNIRCKVSPAMSVLGKMPTSQDASRRPNPSCNCHPCPPSTAGLIDAAKIPSSWCAWVVDCGLWMGVYAKTCQLPAWVSKKLCDFQLLACFWKSQPQPLSSPKVPEAFLATFKKYFASLQQNNVQIKFFQCAS